MTRDTLIVGSTAIVTALTISLLAIPSLVVIGGIGVATVALMVWMTLEYRQ